MKANIIYIAFLILVWGGIALRVATWMVTPLSFEDKVYLFQMRQQSTVNAKILA